ncbi:MAG: CFI-box-CTERM domain-containing protein [Bdellovibrionales bacterium]
MIKYLINFKQTWWNITGQGRISQEHLGLRAEMRWKLMPKTVDDTGIKPAFYQVSVSVTNNSKTHDFVSAYAVFSPVNPKKAPKQQLVYAAPLAKTHVASDDYEVSAENHLVPKIVQLVGKRADGESFDTSSFGFRAKKWGKRLGVTAASVWVINNALLMSGHHTLQGMVYHGLIKDTHCAVATAACGDGNHPIVKEFRRFRSEVLMKNPVGRAFCSWYYRNGPTLAAPLAKSATLRALVRGPLIAGAGAIRLGRRLLSSAPTRQP